MLKLSPISTH